MTKLGHLQKNHEKTLLKRRPVHQSKSDEGRKIEYFKQVTWIEMFSACTIGSNRRKGPGMQLAHGECFTLSIVLNPCDIDPCYII